MGRDDRYCRTHGAFYDPYGSGCPDCRDVENSTFEATRETNYRRANPGDYQCPHCRYTSLKRMASRCPLCRGKVNDDYWDDVQEKERDRAEERRVRRAERDRGEPARRAAAKREASIFSWDLFFIYYFAYFLPIVCVAATLAFQLYIGQVVKFSRQVLLFLIPVLNWILYLVVLFLDSSGAERHQLRVALVACTVIGCVGWLLNAARRLTL